MVDLLFWVFFGAGFLVMAAMILNVFRSIWQGRRDRDLSKIIESKTFLL